MIQEIMSSVHLMLFAQNPFLSTSAASHTVWFHNTPVFGQGKGSIEPSRSTVAHDNIIDNIMDNIIDIGCMTVDVWYSLSLDNDPLILFYTTHFHRG